MELCTSTTVVSCSRLPPSINRHRYLAGNAVVSFPLQRDVASLGLQSRTLRCTGKFQEETSTGVNDEAVDDKYMTNKAQADDKYTTSEAQADSSEDVQAQALEFLNDFKLDSLDSDNTYSILLYGSGAIVALYLISTVVASLESIPLLPKLMEVVGLGYTLWFTSRYLLFKKNREELKTKISELKKEILGSDNE